MQYKEVSRTDTSLQ